MKENFEKQIRVSGEGHDDYDKIPTPGLEEVVPESETDKGKKTKELFLT